MNRYNSLASRRSEQQPAQVPERNQTTKLGLGPSQTLTAEVVYASSSMKPKLKADHNSIVAQRNKYVQQMSLSQILSGPILQYCKKNASLDTELDNPV